MGIPDGAHTHGSGGGAGTVLLVLIAAAVLGPAVTAAAGLLRLLVIIGAVILGLAAIGVLAAVAWRVRQQRPETPRVVYRITPAPPRAVQGHTEPQAIGRAPEVHLHLHGVSAEDIAALLSRQHPPGGHG